MNRLICVIPYCAHDVDLAKNLLTWIGQLGGCPGHSCVLAPDAVVPKDQRMALKALALQTFDNVETHVITPPQDGYAPNHMFMLTAKQIMANFKMPWLWCEPDAVPLKHGWLDQLATEYAQSPKRFVGNLVNGNQPGLPAVHLTGVSIYPPDAFEVYEKFPSIRSANVAWDMEAASDVVPRSQHTDLIQSFWGKRDLPPTFVKEKLAGSPENALPLSFISPEAVLFHRSKDGSLINLLREQETQSKLQESPEPITTTAPRRGRPPKNHPAPTITA